MRGESEDEDERRNGGRRRQNEATWGEKSSVPILSSFHRRVVVLAAALFLLSSSLAHVLFILCSPSLIIWRHSSFPRLFHPFISFPFFLISITIIVISWSNGMISERRHTIPFTHTPALTADGWEEDADWQVSLMLKQVHAASEIPGYSWGSKFVSHFTIAENCPLAVHSFTRSSRYSDWIPYSCTVTLNVPAWIKASFSESILPFFQTLSPQTVSSCTSAHGRCNGQASCQEMLRLWESRMEIPDQSGRNIGKHG